MTFVGGRPGQRSAATPVMWLMATICLLAACGDAGTSTSRGPAPSAGRAGAPIPPCTVLTQADAEKALGGPVKDPVDSMGNELDTNEGDSCSYTTVGPQSAGVVQAIVFVHPDAAGARQTYDGLAASSRQTVPVTGVGDGAFLVNVGMGSGTLILLHNAAIVQLVLRGAAQPDSAPVLKQLATAVAARL